MKGFTSPESQVLPDEAVIPDHNLISPPPNQFTHQLKRKAPYYFNHSTAGAAADGELPPGAKVVLLVHGDGAYCRVVNDQGLYVEVEYNSLEPLANA